MGRLEEGPSDEDVADEREPSDTLLLLGDELFGVPTTTQVRSLRLGRCWKHQLCATAAILLVVAVVSTFVAQRPHTTVDSAVQGHWGEVKMLLWNGAQLGRDTAPPDSNNLVCAAPYNDDCKHSKCCKEAGQQCFQKYEYWAACKYLCDPYAKDADGRKWTCNKLGFRAGPTPKPAVGTLQCAPAGVNCRPSNCCNAKGMQCWEKNATWAECAPGCQPSPGWSCKAVGIRTALEPVRKSICSWSGDDCTMTKCCNDVDVKCYKKDASYAMCNAAECSGPGKPKHWISNASGWWSCDVLGGSVADWGPAWAAPPGQEAGVSLFCFTVVTPDTYEVDLVYGFQKSKWLGIFSCDTHQVYWGSHVRYIKDGTWKSFVNTGVFLTIWNKVRDEGLFRNADWTVKVDPDAVFFPNVLQDTLRKLRPKVNLPLYINNQPKWKSRGFAGPIEIFSKAAVELFIKSGSTCKKPYRLATSGEDTYMKTCMDALGCKHMDSPALLNNHNKIAECGRTGAAAYHAFKNATVWMACHDSAAAGYSAAAVR